MERTQASKGSQTGSTEGQHHLIELRQVRKVFRTAAGEFTALKDVDLQIGPGEFVAVIGKSGSGKSTLINMITGIDRPTRGEVFVDGTPVHKLSQDKLAKWRGRRVGVIFQFFQLLPTLTVLENLMLPMDFCNMYARRAAKSPRPAASGAGRTGRSGQQTPLLSLGRAAAARGNRPRPGQRPANPGRR